MNVLPIKTTTSSAISSLGLAQRRMFSRNIGVTRIGGFNAAQRQEKLYREMPHRGISEIGYSKHFPNRTDFQCKTGYVFTSPGYNPTQVHTSLENYRGDYIKVTLPDW